MVRSKSHSSSDDEREHHHKEKHHRKRSSSPKRSHKKQRTRSSTSPLERSGDVKRKIKSEPLSNTEGDSSPERKPKMKKEHTLSRGDREHNRHRIQGERHADREMHHRAGRHGHSDNVRVKQEPDSEEDMRQQRNERRVHDQRRRENRQKRGLPEREQFGRPESDAATGGQENAAQQPKDAPNFELSGKLTEDTNTYKGVVIKYNEPPEARKPKKRWRLYPFKNDEALKPFHMHRQSAFLFGRDRIIADIPVDHPSCSKQHAVFQYRMVPYEKPDGRKAYKIAPYIIDLESANGTFVNNKRIESRCYVELMEKDVIKFGFSSREYVLLHDKSNTDEVASDVSD